MTRRTTPTDQHPTREERAALCELPRTAVTLNGNPAKITGYSQPFATVTDLRTRLSCEWAWSTVARIVAKGGRFES